jgi:hypothetical protein
MILVVGQHPDPHIETVCAILRSKGVSVCVLDRHSTEGHVSFEISDSGYRGLLRAHDLTIDLEEISCVWWRVKPATPIEFPGGEGTLTEAFRAKEWNALLRSLPAWLPRARWINPILGPELPRAKPAQLLLAREVGFAIPDTVISNAVDDVADIFSRHERVIYKTLDSFVIPPDKIIYTNIAEKDDVLSRSEQIRLAPCMFQEFVNKRYELRVTVVGDRVFSVAIDSQSDARTQIDWRRDQGRGMYSAIDIAEPVISQMRAFMDRAALSYAAFDFAVTPDGEPVFLECNPGGQWLWLEKATGLPISEALADLLAAAA